MEIKHQKDQESGTFFIEINGTREAEMTYRYINTNTIDINHTEVNDALKGEGVGSKLVEAAVKFLRENNLKAVASCSYVSHVFDKKQEMYKDIISG
ncbi:N-acetyltransferase [Bizionia argentinensis JUB59]|uniref:N-acetyltransferase n=2 Tax=Bizionia TaxID=283785 RepID=G2E9U6_9FLAO|nr:N-acetyltransferase [Bizionia argentinensis JUB59]